MGPAVGEVGVKAARGLPRASGASLRASRDSWAGGGAVGSGRTAGAERPAHVAFAGWQTSGPRAVRANTRLFLTQVYISQLSFRPKSRPEAAHSLGWPLVYGIVAGRPDDALAPMEPWRHRLIWTQQCNGPAYHGFAIRQPSVQIGNRFCACCRRPNSFRSSSFQPGQPSQMASRRCFPSGPPGPDGKFLPGVPASYWLGTSGSEAPPLAKGTALT